MSNLFPAYSIESLQREIEIAEALKETLRLEIGRFVDETNDELSKRDLPYLMARVTDRSNNNLIYRIRNQERTRTSYLSGLDTVLDRKKYSRHLNWILEIELTKEGINRRWSMHQYNLTRSKYLLRRLVDLKKQYPRQFKNSIAQCPET